MQAKHATYYNINAALFAKYRELAVATGQGINWEYGGTKPNVWTKPRMGKEQLK